MCGIYHSGRLTRYHVNCFDFHFFFFILCCCCFDFSLFATETCKQTTYIIAASVDYKQSKWQTKAKLDANAGGRTTWIEGIERIERFVALVRGLLFFLGFYYVRMPSDDYRLGCKAAAIFYEY